MVKAKRPADNTDPSSKAKTNPNDIVSVETADNLMFDDANEDEFIEEDVVENCSDDGDGDDNMFDGGEDDEQSSATNLATQQVYMPGQTLPEGEELEYDASAYSMYHAMKPEWPCLTFDIIKDNLGSNRTRFPHTVYCVAGTQADQKDKNKLQLMKLSDMSKTYKKQDNGDSDDDEALDSDGDDSDNDNVDSDPILEHVDIAHSGCVNRVRCMPQKPNIVATFSETSHVHIFDLSAHIASFDNRQGTAGLSNRPIFTHSGHKTEGYAMDWSGVSAGQFLTGDCSGAIDYWLPNEGGGGWNVSSKAWKCNDSVEDIQFSPTEGTVFASGDCGGNIQIFDTRQKGKSMLCSKAHDTDVNVISWNKIVTNLLASGADDGVFSVWDLRNFKKGEPLAKFTTSSKPITSCEWHGTDESMIVVSDEDAVFVYDLSIEEDAEEAAKTASATLVGEKKIPPQLLFMHLGSQSNKEAHWHPQIPSMIMSTALSGFNVFIPSNL